MSDGYDNTDRAVLFKNLKKTEDKQPDYKGWGDLAGVEFWISAWISVSKKDGSKYMQLKVKRKDEDEHSKPPAPAPKAGAFDDDDQIPF